MILVSLSPFSLLFSLTSRIIIITAVLQPKLLALCVPGMNSFMCQQLLSLDLVLHTLRNIGHQVRQDSRYYEDEMLGRRGETLKMKCLGRKSLIHGQK